MLRMALGLGVAAVLAAATGCTMCCHPYDQCGPVYGGPCHSSCSPCYRANSTLAGTADSMSAVEARRQAARQRASSQVATAAGPMASSTVAQRQAARQPTSQAAMEDAIPADAKPGTVAGSQRILSVTDRKVESPAAPAAQHQVASESPSESAGSVTSTGWTAVRPSSTEVAR